MRKISLSVLIVALLSFGSAYAHSGPTEPQTGKDILPATAEFNQAMNQMHGPMMEGIKDSDPDTAFVKGMIAHHEGAVEMSKTVLKYGKDPEIRQLAQSIIRDQEKEIKIMRDWLTKREK